MAKRSRFRYSPVDARGRPWKRAMLGEGMVCLGAVDAGEEREVLAEDRPGPAELAGDADPGRG
jgi:hypothetical protein